jgi:transketolase
MTVSCRSAIEKESLKLEAAELRREIVEALYACGGGHYGGSLSVLDIILTLYRGVLRMFPDEPQNPSRDRFILSKGHSCMALYAVLRRIGFFTYPLVSYGRFNSPLEGHPDMTVLPGIDFSTGSLGQGLSVGLGMALSLRDTDQHTWVVIGDGECQEGQVWEAAMLAARYEVSHLHAVIDVNRFQEWGWDQDPEADTSPVSDLAAKWEAFGWRVYEVDGHDHDELAATFKNAMSTKRQPSVVLARTVKGKGYKFIESDPIRFHCATVEEHEHSYILESSYDTAAC